MAGHPTRTGQPPSALAAASAATPDTSLHYWGTRGGRNAVASQIGQHTSCCSLTSGGDLYVFDAGSGLLELSAAILTDPLLAAVRRIHVLVTHAHMDHWEGLKDADWMWRKKNGLELAVYAPREALDVIRRTHEPPSFVPLEILALGTVARFSIIELTAGRTIERPGATLETLALNHYSGMPPNIRPLETLGYRLAVFGGPTVAYLCDHEPTSTTLENELAAVAPAQLAIVDASYSDYAEHAFGHGSIEFAAQLARQSPDVRVIAGHHGPLRTDDVIEAAARRHAVAGGAGLGLAIEGRRDVWDPQARAFKRR